MDSLTQITLGAAVGEVVLGKKAGNRAMVWGAIAGTIPDLDVFADPFLTPLQELAFHRGISHSFFFSIFFGLLLAWLVQKFYASNIHKSKIYRYTLLVLVLLFFLFAGYILNSIPVAFGGEPNSPLIVVSIGAFGYLLFRFWKNYVSTEQHTIDFTFKDWFLLFFWCLVTHPILDSFTSYGTQLFQPFSDYRVGFNNISVADPLYTLPFLIFLIASSCYKRGSKRRYQLNMIGIIISSLYMVWTISNKLRVDAIFEKNLEEQGIEYSRAMTSPTILQNVLWHCIAEGDSVYYDGLYSLFDSEPNVIIKEIPKNYHLLDKTEENDHTLERLSWFSNGYYGIMDVRQDSLQVNDLRYGTFRGDGDQPEDYIFSFVIAKDEKGDYEMADMQAGPPEDREDNWFVDYWTRIKGI